jgi:hypothetical protein
MPPHSRSSPLPSFQHFRCASEEEFDETFGLNVKVPFSLAGTLAPAMAERHGCPNMCIDDGVPGAPPNAGYSTPGYSKTTPFDDLPPPVRTRRGLCAHDRSIDGQALLPHTRVRRDRVDMTGCFTLRYRSKLHHVAVGRAHKGKRVLILVADLDIRVIDENGVTIRHLELDPSVDYQGRARAIL